MNTDHDAEWAAKRAAVLPDAAAEIARLKMKLWLTPGYVLGILSNPDGTATIVTLDGNEVTSTSRADLLAEVLRKRDEDAERLEGAKGKLDALRDTERRPPWYCGPESGKANEGDSGE